VTSILNSIIVDELNEIKESFSSERRTEIVDDYDDIDIEDLIPNEPMVVTITHSRLHKEGTTQAV